MMIEQSGVGIVSDGKQSNGYVYQMGLNKRDWLYNFLFERTNKVLLLAGLKVTKEGKIIEVVQAKTLDEVDRRVNSLQRQLYNRAIHGEVQKYCIKDYFYS